MVRFDLGRVRRHVRRVLAVFGHSIWRSSVLGILICQKVYLAPDMLFFGRTAGLLGTLLLLPMPIICRMLPESNLTA